RHSDSASNYLGTYTFERIDTYLAGQPSNYTRRTGDPNVSYHSLEAGEYLQDDIRVTKNFTLSPGVRYELQTHVKSGSNVGPRLGATHAPVTSAQITH